MALCLLGCGRDLTGSPAANANVKKEVPAKPARAIKSIEPFFKPMGTPAVGGWLASHHETGQTFEEYLNEEPTLPTPERQKLYVLPLGRFGAIQKKVIAVTSGYLEAFYGLPVEQLPTRPFTAAFPHTRQNKLLHTTQTNTGYVINEVLPPLLPRDAAALIAFTADDLYPDETMNFVFGQASFDKRVGVWSLHRLAEHAGYDVFLRRTLKIAAHETGHLFSIRHCTKYECVMSGTNYLGETDSRPIDACPEDMAKIAWISHREPKARYERLESFCRRNRMIKEADDFARKGAALGD